jgi:PncC family amidohydrolase
MSGIIFEKRYNFFMTQHREIYLGQLLSERDLWLATAESFTGGLLGHLITNVPGSSSYFRGGVIAYANEVKMGMLRVSAATLDNYGAVSKETVLEMARGVREALKTDIGLSMSGIAGPDGGSDKKPVGTVWIGLSTMEIENAEKFIFSGDRQKVKEKAANMALQLIIDHLAD